MATILKVWWHVVHCHVYQRSPYVQDPVPQALVDQGLCDSHHQALAQESAFQLLQACVHGLSAGLRVQVQCGCPACMLLVIVIPSLCHSCIATCMLVCKLGAFLPGLNVCAGFNALVSCSNVCREFGLLFHKHAASCWVLMGGGAVMYVGSQPLVLPRYCAEGVDSTAFVPVEPQALFSVYARLLGSANVVPPASTH